jgi:hypothetical protein
LARPKRKDNVKENLVREPERERERDKERERGKREREEREGVRENGRNL